MRRTRHSKDSRKYFDWLEIAAGDLLAARLPGIDKPRGIVYTTSCIGAYSSAG